MPTNYSLAITNNSTQFQNLCIYQKPVDLGVPNALSLAWLTAPAWPGTTVTFNWDVDYCFVWSQTGTLQPGVTFKAQQTVSADPNNLNNNQVVFADQLPQWGGTKPALTFLPGSAAGNAQLGSLYIRELSTIPPRSASVGIGMSNAGVFVVDAEPNMNLVFTPHPEYWVTAGLFEQGEVLNIEQITNTAMVDFNSTFNMNAVLAADNTWTITSGQS